MEIKKCYKCQLNKPLSEYHKDKSKPGGLGGYCNECRQNKNKQNYSSEYSKIKVKEAGYKHQRKWNEKNRSDGYFKQYAQNGYWNNYQKRRRVDDPFYSLYINLRSRISNLLTGKTKSKRTQQIIGLSLDEFKHYIENKWIDNMNWGNYGYGEGKWVIDHIQPIASAQTEEDIYKLNHYTNLQPMWWYDNLVKGGKSK
jgi:hypothetical protein